MLSQTFFEGNAIREGDTLYLKVNVCPEFTKALTKSSDITHTHSEKDLTVSELFKLKTQQK